MGNEKSRSEGEQERKEQNRKTKKKNWSINSSNTHPIETKHFYLYAMVRFIFCKWTKQHRTPSPTRRSQCYRSRSHRIGKYDELHKRGIFIVSVNDIIINKVRKTWAHDLTVVDVLHLSCPIASTARAKSHSLCKLKNHSSHTHANMVHGKTF